MRTRDFILVVATSVLVFGCTSTSERMAEKGIEPMTAAEIRETISGNSLYLKGPYYEYAGYFKPDGTLIDRVWWNGGEETSTGIWEIKDEGLICRNWENDWGGGGYGCSHWYRDGENIVFDAVSGSKGKISTGTMTPSTGNAYEL